MTQEHLSEKELLSQLEGAHKVVEVGAVYAHYRDPKSHYKVLSLAILEATQEVAVIYQKADASSPISWIRPISSWVEKVSIGNALVQRFQCVTTAQLDLKEW